MKKQYGTHEKCCAFRHQDGVVLICGRSAGHSVLKCWDPDEDRSFLAPERKGFPKIQPLGIRKLTPMVSELKDALELLREFLDPKDEGCAVPPEFREDPRVQSFLSTWVEGPMARVLAQMDPRWRAEEQDRNGVDPL
jgi:hypothetical protein